MGAFLSELGKRLAERWVTLLVLPGLLYTAACAAAAVLGQRGWADVTALVNHVDRVGMALDKRSATLAVVLIGTVLVAAAAGLLAQAVATLVERTWLGNWPPPLYPLRNWLARRRATRWATANAEFTRVRDDPTLRGRERQIKLDGLAAARNRICPEPPTHPTWIGDRLRAADARVWKQYQLDLASAWPRLWLVAQDGARAAVREARDRFDASTALTAWGLLYAFLGLRWWPAAVIGVILIGAGTYRGRLAAAALADLTEAVVDLYRHDLARSLGLLSKDEYIVSARVGRQVTEQLRKGT
jgi:hypothetical protein